MTRAVTHSGTSLLRGLESHSTSAGMAFTWRMLMRVVARAAARFAAWRSRRRTIRELSAFSDHMLHDIGITRHQIPRVVRCGRDWEG